MSEEQWTAVCHASNLRFYCYEFQPQYNELTLSLRTYAYPPNTYIIVSKLAPAVDRLRLRRLFLPAYGDEFLLLQFGRQRSSPRLSSVACRAR